MIKNNKKNEMRPNTELLVNVSMLPKTFLSVFENSSYKKDSSPKSKGIIMMPYYSKNLSNYSPKTLNIVTPSHFEVQFPMWLLALKKTGSVNLIVNHHPLVQDSFICNGVESSPVYTYECDKAILPPSGEDEDRLRLDVCRRFRAYIMRQSEEPEKIRFYIRFSRHRDILKLGFSFALFRTN